MDKKRKALGKGLEQLFGSEQMNIDNFENNIVSESRESDIKLINLSDIRKNPYQPRSYFDEDALKELSSSIEEHGVLQPIILKKSIKGYELVAGERRTKAAKLAGLKRIPSIVKDFTDEEMMDIALLENIQREDLTPIEVAKAFDKYIKDTKITQSELSKKFGKTRSYVTNMLGLLSLPENVKSLIETKELSMSHARALSKLEDDSEIIKLSKKIIKEDLSVRALEDLLRKPKQKEKNQSTLPLKYKIVEEALIDKTGNKVKVNNNNIIIPFDSEGDLYRILEILNIKIK